MKSDNSTSDNQLDAMGRRCLIVTGAAKTSMPTGWYAQGCSCRIDGSIIASAEKAITKTTVAADTDETIVGVSLLVSDNWLPFINKVRSVTQTGAADSIIYWLKQL